MTARTRTRNTTKNNLRCLACLEACQTIDNITRHADTMWDKPPAPVTLSGNWQTSINVYDCEIDLPTVYNAAK